MVKDPNKMKLSKQDLVLEAAKAGLDYAKAKEYNANLLKRGLSTEMEENEGLTLKDALKIVLENLLKYPEDPEDAYPKFVRAKSSIKKPKVLQGPTVIDLTPSNP